LFSLINSILGTLLQPLGLTAGNYYDRVTFGLDKPKFRAYMWARKREVMSLFSTSDVVFELRQLREGERAVTGWWVNWRSKDRFFVFDYKLNYAWLMHGELLSERTKS
jgi:hypothetical protein